MKTITEIRRENLIEILKDFRTIAEFNETMGRKRTDPSFGMIKNQQVNPNRGKPRIMGDKLAREIELRLNLPDGWMDSTHLTNEEDASKSGVPYIEGTPKVIPIPTIVLQGGEGKMDNVVVYLDPELFDKYFQGRKRSDFHAAIVLDNSMSPKLNSNDRVLIDTAMTEFTTAGIYCLQTPAGKVLRDIHSRLDGVLIIRASGLNEEVEFNSIPGIKIVGKVRLKWTTELLP